MAKDTALVFIKQTIRSLKRDMPTRVVIHRRASESVDVETGKKTVSTDSWTVNRAIVLAGHVNRKFVYDLTFIAAAKNFTYGGHFDTDERRLIIDRADLPSGWEPKRDDYIVIDKVRYEVQTFDNFADFAIVYDVKALRGQIAYSVEQPSVISTLHLNDVAEATL